MPKLLKNSIFKIIKGTRLGDNRLLEISMPRVGVKNKGFKVTNPGPKRVLKLTYELKATKNNTLSPYYDLHSTCFSHILAI